MPPGAMQCMVGGDAGRPSSIFVVGSVCEALDQTEMTMRDTAAMASTFDRSSGTEWPPISAASSAVASRARSIRMTVIPAFARSREIAAQMAPAAPVTAAVLPCIAMSGRVLCMSAV